MFDAIYNSTDSLQLATQLNEIMSATGNHSVEEINNTIKAMTSSWYVAFVKLNPEKYLSQVKCPVLAINGTWDFQVDAEQNLEMAQKMLPTATIKQFEGLNHMFQPAPTRQASMNYGAIETTISEQVLKTIADWIIDQMIPLGPRCIAFDIFSNMKKLAKPPTK
jgi:hypothetical protein